MGLLLIGLLSIINAPYPAYLPLQHIPTIVGLSAFLGLSRRYPLSNISFVCIVIFFLLHVLGARYIYTYVPYDEWSEALIGKSLSEMFGWQRNQYDRLVHFAFGLLFYIPLREVFIRFVKITPGKSAFFAFLVIIASGGMYELLEWLVAIILAPDQVEAYNGQQGDVWDPQKDMLMSTIGVLLIIPIASRFSLDGKKVLPIKVSH